MPIDTHILIPVPPSPKPDPAKPIEIETFQPGVGRPATGTGSVKK